MRRPVAARVVLALLCLLALGVPAQAGTAATVAAISSAGHPPEVTLASATRPSAATPALRQLPLLDTVPTTTTTMPREQASSLSAELLERHDSAVAATPRRGPPLRS